MSKKIYILLFVAALHSSVFSLSDENFKKICSDALSGRDGAIILADAKSGRIIAAVGSDDILDGRRFFPPGSVFKIVTALAALENGVSPDEKVKCTYWYNAPDGRMRCSWYPGHGFVDVKRAISVSCSFYFYHLVDEGISPQKIMNTASLLGFDESPAKNVPPVRWRKLKTANFPYMFAIGLRDVEVSPYHILRMIYAVANRGIAPFNCENFPQGASRISHKNYDIVRAGLRSAVVDGIAKSAAPENIPSAGKTGTAPLTENPEMTCGWFAGYIPFEFPQYLLVILITDGTGFSDAAPIAGKIFKILYRESIIIEEKR